MADRASDDGTVVAARGMVASVDRLASEAGVDVLRSGGSAADAAIAANAVLAVTCQHLCGLGGDLLAMVHAPGDPAPAALLSAGRAGSGADAAALRAEGHRVVPRFRDLRAATVPGCVDGWIALHERFGRLPLASVLGPARELAASGFSASASLARAAARIVDVAGADDYRLPGGLRAGAAVTRTLVARALEAIGDSGQDGYYGGDFGRGLVELGRGAGGGGRDLFSPEDLSRPIAEWVEPIGLDAWGSRLWTTPAPSQGYLVPAAAWIAGQLDLPVDPDDPRWAHLLSEAARWAGHDRPELLFDGAAATSLLDLERLAAGLDAIRPDRRTAPPSPVAGGGTTYLCATDGDGMAVSLIESNAAGWGGGIVVPGTGIFLHNRGLGFSLEAGHPAELAPGRRPPHTLAPALVTAPDGSLVAALGTMGGDAQPQIVLQLLARLLHAGSAPGAALAAPRWFLGHGGFDVWTDDSERQLTSLEADAPRAWVDGLADRGHQVAEAPVASAGHAQVILRRPDGTYAGAADPRMPTGAAVGLD